MPGARLTDPSEALILRSITKAGTPRGLADLKTKLFLALWRILNALPPFYGLTISPVEVFIANFPGEASFAYTPAFQLDKFSSCRNGYSDTGC
jgi:hypothetical protein